MKKKIAILISLFIILVVVFAPVKLAENLIPKNNSLVISGMQGSIWSGEIDSVDIMGWRLQEVNYDLSVISLLSGNLGGSGEVQAGDIKGDFSFDIEDQKNIKIAEVNIQTAAINFEKYLPFPGIELGGKVSTKEFYAQLANQKPVVMSGMTSWDNASLDLNGKRWSLGSFDVIWTTDTETNLIVGTIGTSKKNKLGLDGRISLTKNGLLEFKGSILQSIDKSIYTAFSLFADGSAKSGRLPIKFKKKVL
jgi:hypothetical protein